MDMSGSSSTVSTVDSGLRSRRLLGTVPDQGQDGFHTEYIHMSGLLGPEQDLPDSEGHNHQRGVRLCLAPSYFSLPLSDKILY